jgi:hypothetical protein
MKTRTETLEQKTDFISSEVSEIKADSMIMSDQINQLQQQALANDFSIKGFPNDIKPESIMQIINKFGEKIEENIMENDLKNIYIQKNRNGACINGTFFDLRKKHKVFENFKKKRPIVAEDVCEISKESPLNGTEITIKNQLTQYNRNLLHEARRLSPNFQFVWESNGRILVKQHPGSRTIHIRTYQQLQDITSNNNHPKK